LALFLSVVEEVELGVVAVVVRPGASFAFVESGRVGDCVLLGIGAAFRAERCLGAVEGVVMVIWVIVVCEG